ncbi:YdcH family protein [Pseudooceanicola sp. MF1-13]|uniref:YdcH family protein n=1 Tax=Pseudooceanicola sp. MF1-13 TaxID=3379095 RepID=UPI0038917AF6
MTTHARHRPAFTARIAQLRRRRQNLAKQIEDELRRPVPCSIALKRLKQQRVRLKDQIASYSVHSGGGDTRPAHMA